MAWKHVAEWRCDILMPKLGTRWWMVSFTPQPSYVLWNNLNTHSTEGWVNPKAGLNSLQKIFFPSRHKKDDSSLIVQPPAPVFLKSQVFWDISTIPRNVDIYFPAAWPNIKDSLKLQKIYFIFIVFQSHSTRQRCWNNAVKDLKNEICDVLEFYAG
jgi:hypothetical protein